MAKKLSEFFSRVQHQLKWVRATTHRLRTLLLLLTLFFGTAVLPTFAHLARETPIIQSALNAQSVVQQGRSLYEAGQYVEAIKLWQQAVAAFKSQGDALRQAMTLSNLCLAYQQLGQWTQAREAITESLNLLQIQQNLDTPKERSQLLAQALDIQGNLQLAQGQAQAALTTWKRAAEIYTQLGSQAAVIQSRINQAQALQALGLYLPAQKTLTELQSLLQKQSDSPLKATGLRSLGNVLRVVGDLKESRRILEQSLTVAKAAQSAPDIYEAQLSLGNTARAQNDSPTALAFYQQAAAASASPTTRIQAQLNQLSLLVETNQASAVPELLPQIQSQISNLPPSRAAVYAQINFAQSLMKMGKSKDRPFSIPKSLEVAQLLATAVQQAQTLQDPRAESYALGMLGQLYEQSQQWANAENLTQKALVIAQAIDAPDITYQWQWQLGRLKSQSNLNEAIRVYDEAFTTLQSLRSDLAAINPDVQFSFRESVEPVYREYVDLLLRTETTAQLSQDNLRKAREVIESLKVAELENFFGEACLEPKQQLDQVVDQVPTAAIIYPVILPDRLEVILKLPQQPLRHYATAIPQPEVERILEDLRRQLVKPHTLRQVQSLSQQVYQWLIQPALTDLAQQNIKTLVFALDGSLRNIPMAVLYDGKHYLIENYSVVLTPSLQLVDPKPLKQQQIRIMAAGVSQPRLGFSALPNVERELTEIQSELPSQVLLNEQFTTQTFQDQVNSLPFPVIHLATHGQFSSNADETFIVAWDEKIKVNQLSQLLQTRDQSSPNKIELLILSACQTAAGDKRAALGLAGVAVRAGARSTLASLWNVNDESTAVLMTQLYRELANKPLTKAEALRQAQLMLLQNPEYQLPMYWAPYVLVGNWL